MSRFTHELRLKKRIADANRGAKGFACFWDTLEFIYVFCFVCGNHIPKLEHSNALQPFGKNRDWVHKSCYESYIRFEDANTKLSPVSRLICHVEPAFSDVPTRVCRERVFNTESSVKEHLASYHPHEFTRELSLEYLRSSYFLKPTGKLFPKVTV